MIFLGPQRAVWDSKGARDYASYHYAIQTAWEGQNPYQTENLHIRARQEDTRKFVHPFFYPPPSLFSFVWAPRLSLELSARIFFWLNQFCLFFSLWHLYRWLKTPIWFLAGLAIFFSPIADSMKMGQLNLLILALLSYALSRNNGAVLGYAAMSKMSPALLFFQWIAQRKWKPALICAMSVPVLSLLVLPLVGLEWQKQFYLEILPQFSSGQYHGLQIPINLPANHSIPDLFNQIWPGKTQHGLSEKAKQFSSVTNVSLLLGLLFVSFRWKTEAARRYLYGTMICLMVVFPVYCYEHHLALLLIPIVLAFQAIQNNTKMFQICFGLSLFSVGWPLYMLRWLQKQVDFGGWFLQESKFFGIVGLALICLWGAFQAERSLPNSASSSGVK